MGRVKETHVTNLISNYRNRIINFHEIIKLCPSDDQYKDILDNILILCYDQILTFYLIAFSIYEHVYSLIDCTFRKYLLSDNLLTEKYGNLNIMEITRNKLMIFDSYTFPIILCITLRSHESIKNDFLQIMSVDAGKIDEEILEFTDSLMYLMIYRNQVSHMSEQLKLFSIDDIENNYQMLITYFLRYQQDLVNLFYFFKELTNNMIADGKIKKRR